MGVRWWDERLRDRALSHPQPSRYGRFASGPTIAAHPFAVAIRSNPFTNVTADLVAALRFWARRPLVAAAATLSLATGLAVAIGVFAVADAALWRPLPLPHPERVMWIDATGTSQSNGVSPGLYSAWQTRAHGLEAVAAIRPASAVVGTLGGTVRADGAYVSSAFMTVLSAPPAYGRAITSTDDRPGAPPVLMISHGFWRSHFGGSAAVVGQTVTLAGQPRTIAGVLSEAIDAIGFGFDWIAPLSLTAAQSANVRTSYLSVIGRVDAAHADTVAGELTALAADVGARGDTGEALTVRLEPLKSHLSREARPVMVPLLAAVLGLVLLGALNAASLLLAQGQTRAGELAVRASLGASRSRLLRQLALESAWMAAAAGAGSLVLAMWVIDGLRRTAAGQFVPADITLDVRTVLFTCALVLTVTVVSGLLPAWRCSAVSLRGALARAGRTTSAAPDRLRRALVVAQIALAITIGSAGALMLRTVQALNSAPRGYDDGVLTAAAQFPAYDYRSADEIKAAVARLVSALGEVPGARGVAAATRVPLSGGAPGSDLVLAGEAFTAGVDRQVRIRFTTPGFFEAIGTRMVAGRDVADRDTASSELVVLVNETLARRLTGDDTASVLGRPVKFAVRDFNTRGPATTWSVVGIVADTHDGGPRSAVQPEVYVPVSQGPGGVFEWIGRQVLFAIRTEPGRAPGAASLRAAASRAEPGLPLYDIRTLGDRLRGHLSTERLVTAVLVPLSMAGLALAAFGVFTILVHIVSARRRELAIRMALGATAGRVVRSLLGESVRLTALGTAVGAAGAVFASRALRPLVFGASAADPLTVAGLLLAIAAATGLATWLPARRAASVDPASVLRAD